MVEKIKAFLVSLARNPKEAIRSALTTAVTVSGVLVFAGRYIDVPVEATVSVAALVTFLRTLAAALDGKNESFGRVSKGRHSRDRQPL